MWICVYPHWLMNFNSKNGKKRSFLMKRKDQCHLSQWVEWAYGVQPWKEKRLLCEFVFVLIDERNLILKNGGK